MKSVPEPEIVKELLSYDPETGKFYWKFRDEKWFRSSRLKTAKQHATWWNSRFGGREALSAINGTGYRTGAILKVSVKAHRVAWAIMTGEWPTEEIDHIDHDRANNRWKNLRPVSYSSNRKNMKLYATNRSGVPGAIWRRERWEVTISVLGRRIYIGRFRSLAEALEARTQAQIRHGFHENHGREQVSNGNSHATS